MIRLAVVLLLLSSSALADDLTGLWTAKKRFGPDGRGALVIEKRGEAYSADMLGRQLPVSVDRGELSFALPNGAGSFRGKLAGNAIRATGSRRGTPRRSSANGSGAACRLPRLMACRRERTASGMTPLRYCSAERLQPRARCGGSSG